MLIADGTVDPKTAKDDAGTPKQCFGYNEFPPSELGLPLVRCHRKFAHLTIED